MEVDESVTVVTYKSKTVQDVLSEIAGLLIISRILTSFLHSFNELKFNRKIQKENNEEFRDVFTYSNFKKTLVEIQEMREENREMRVENQEMRVENQQMKAQNIELKKQVDKLMKFMQRTEDIERLSSHSDEKMKNH